MLNSPTHAVVGSRDPDRLARFLQDLGYERLTEDRLPADAARVLYGIDQELAEIVIGFSDTPRGSIRIVQTPQEESSHTPFDPGPLAIDFYTRDIEFSKEMARKAGAQCHEIVKYTAGPVEVREVEAVGPDGCLVVFIEANLRRPTSLDRVESRLHSEVHSLVWTVAAMEPALEFWTGPAGLTALMDTKFDGTIVARLMHLPVDDAPVRFVALADEQGQPIRFELIEFLEHPGEPRLGNKLTPGLWSLGFHVEDPVAVASRLGAPAPIESTPIQTELHRDAEAVSFVVAGNTRIELWKEDSALSRS